VKGGGWYGFQRLNILHCAATGHTNLSSFFVIQSPGSDYPIRLSAGVCCRSAASLWTRSTAPGWHRMCPPVACLMMHRSQMLQQAGRQLIPPIDALSGSALNLSDVAGLPFVGSSSCLPRRVCVSPNIRNGFRLTVCNRRIP